MLFAPLASALLIVLFFRRDNRLAGIISCGAILLSFVVACCLLAEFLEGGNPDGALEWCTVGALRIRFSMHFDVLTMIMLLVVTGIGSLIHMYSIVYMMGDPGFTRYFACLSLFTFSMLGIVVSANFFMMFVFWELVGVSSYLLIGFWFTRPAAADAAKKAFLCNRLGDFGFMIGIIMAWSLTGTLNFAIMQGKVLNNPDVLGSIGTVVALLVFCGAVGKSAQFPLHVWLPDAMEGPTPVSALIHAATMVAAGVYMLCRVFFVLTGSAHALHIISWIGGITALMAALIAIQQDDIKRILAYSTLSQLGYMIMAVGFDARPAAMFHLTTHAFFKALLFLSSGAVIHAMHHEQNIWTMGELRDKIPLTFRVFLIGTLALCGFPGFSGFYSKDAILTAAWENNKVLFGVGLFTAFLTTFYMFRLCFVVFWGKPRTAVAAEKRHPKKSRLIAYPLTALSILSLIGGFIGIEQFLSQQFEPEAKAIPFFALSTIVKPFTDAPIPAVLGLVAFVVGIAIAYAIYGNAPTDPIANNLPGLSKVLRNKFYFDELYAEIVALCHDLPAQYINYLDQFIQFFVRFAHGTTEWTGRMLRLFQSGRLQTYTLLTAAGIALALYLMLTR